MSVRVLYKRVNVQYDEHDACSRVFFLCLAKGKNSKYIHVEQILSKRVYSKL